MLAAVVCMCVHECACMSLCVRAQGSQVAGVVQLEGRLREGRPSVGRDSLPQGPVVLGTCGRSPGGAPAQWVAGESQSQRGDPRDEGEVMLAV